MCEIIERLLELEKDKHVYPLTIINDRYGGLYSGAHYLAFNLEPWDVPRGISWGGDVDCAEFWGEESVQYIIGKGDTPEEALNDLIRLKMISNWPFLKGVHLNGLRFPYYCSMYLKIKENEEVY